MGEVPYLTLEFASSFVFHVIVAEVDVMEPAASEVIIGAAESLTEKFLVKENPVSPVVFETHETFHWKCPELIVWLIFIVVGEAFVTESFLPLGVLFMNKVQFCLVSL